MAKLDHTKDDPWELTTPPGTSAYSMHVEERDGKTVLVCTVGKTVLLYDARCVDDLHTMLRATGEWIDLGGADDLYVPPWMEALGLCELERNPKNNRMRAK